MKTTSRSVYKTVLAALVGLFILGGASSLWADECDSRYVYQHDPYGYWDGHNRYHHFVYFHDHRGYWGWRGSVRVFINVG